MIEQILKDFDEKIAGGLSFNPDYCKQVKNFLKDSIQKAIEQRDKEWLSCIPLEYTFIEEDNKKESTGYNMFRKNFLQNLKDKKIID